MLSLTCKTAIRAVIYLAANVDSGSRAGIPEIAGEIAASPHTVGKLLQTLVKANILSSSKGPTGGFYLTPRQMRLPVMAIVQAIDGREVFRTCGLGLSNCSARRPCPLHTQYAAVRDGFEKLCRENTIADLAAPLNQGRAYFVGH